MVKYFLSENLKVKNKFINKLTWLMPLLTMILAIFLTANYFQIDSYNWWYTLMFPGLVSITGASLSKVDGSMKNRGTLSLPVNLKKVWIGKVLVGVKNISIACMIIFIGSQINPIFVGIQSELEITFLNGFLAAVLLVITFMWQVPITLFIASKIGFYLSIFINLTMNVIGLILATGKYWWVNPFSYADRLMCPVLKILPNGLIAKPGSQTFTPELISYNSIPVGILVSIILFLIITYLTANWYEKQEAM